MSVEKIVFRNAFFSYGRTLIASGVTLFSSRWILEDLGASDFGLYGLVGGVLTFVALISGVLGNGANRFMSYASGSERPVEVRKWFNVAANVYFCLPAILLPLGVVVGECCVRFLLKIPQARLGVCLWIVRLTLLSMGAMLFSMPYQSLLIARQQIHLYALITLGQSVGVFLIAFVLPYCPGNHLLVYALLASFSLVFVQAIFVVVCRRVCPEGRIDREFWWQWKCIKELISYSGWVFIGSVGMFLREQGLNVILNWIRGTTANAGRAIGLQLGTQTETLYNSFAMALNPEITRREGAGQHDQMLELAKRSERFGVVVILLVGLPLFCECEYVLRLWLKNPPPYAAFFTRIQILIAILCKMRIGHMMCFQAIGLAKPQQLVDFCFYTITVLVVGVSYLLFRSLEIAFVSFVLAQVVYMLSYVVVGSRHFNWPLKLLMKEIVFPATAIFVVGLGGFAVISKVFPDPTFLRLLLVTSVLCGWVALAAVWCILKRDDRQAVVSLFSKMKNRFI